MKLMVLTAAVWPTEEIARQKLWIFLRSCKKFGIDPQLYGIGHQFPGYIYMKLDMQLAYLKEHAEDYTHVLYTDGWDAFFTRGLDVIKTKYELMGQPPILSSAYLSLGNASDMTIYAGCFDETLLYRYPNVGGYIGEIPLMIEMFTRMNRNTGDDCFSWYDAWREGWFRPVLDSQCEIFNVADDHLMVRHGQLYNGMTCTSPCILHLSGGYTDPVDGKDDRMIPWARRLGVIE